MARGLVDPLLDDVQQVIDDLSATLGHSVALDEPDGALITTSRHHGDEDEYRRRLVLARDITPRVRDYLRGFRLPEQVAPVRIPALECEQFAARVCYPVRSATECLALLWVYDHGQDVPDARILARCQQLGRILDRRRQMYGLSSQPRRRLIELAITGGRASGALELALLRYGLGEGDRCQLAVVADAGDPEHAGLTAAGLARALQTARAEVGLPTAECAPVQAYGAAAGIVLGPLDARTTATSPTALAEALRVVLAEHVPGSAPIGVSGVHSLRSLRHVFCEAATAALVGAAMMPGERVILAEELGDLPQLLASLGSLGVPLVARLRDVLHGDPTTARTLHAYLRHGGDTARTTADLAIHRTTLYYRLEQITKRTGLDLSDGRCRALAHLVLVAEELQADPLMVDLQRASSH